MSSNIENIQKYTIKLEKGEVDTLIRWSLAVTTIPHPSSPLTVEDAILYGVVSQIRDQVKLENK